MGISYKVKVLNRLWKRTVSKRQVGFSDEYHEGSRTAKFHTDEQELHTEAGVCTDEVARHTEVQ